MIHSISKGEVAVVLLAGGQVTKVEVSKRHVLIWSAVKQDPVPMLIRSSIITSVY